MLVEEVRREDLRKGPGHTPHTALPGQPGTFAVSGHRTTYGAPFDDLDRLAPGDTVRIQTTTAIYTYTVTRSIVVFPRDTWVLNDVRGADGKLKATIVLTTCTPRYSARQRLVVFGELASSMTLADPTT